MRILVLDTSDNAGVSNFKRQSTRALLDDSAILKVQHAVGIALEVRVVGDLPGTKLRHSQIEVMNSVAKRMKGE